MANIFTVQGTQPMIKKHYALFCSILLACGMPICAASDLPNPQTVFNFDTLQNLPDNTLPNTMMLAENTTPASNINHGRLLEKHSQDDSINTPSQDDVLRKQKIKPQESAQQNAEAELLANPEQLEKILVLNLANNNPQHLPTLRTAYAKTANHDASLLEWADAMMLAKTNVNKAIRGYRNLLAKFPDNAFIRFQLASLLYHNQEFEAAKVQFEKLRAQPDLKPEDVKVFDAFLAAIAKKDKWNFSVGATFLNDKNLTDSADVGTKMVLANGAVLTQSSPKQSGKGVNISTNIDRKWSFEGGKYTAVNADVSMKYYWDNKAFNELTAYGSASVGYMDVRHDAKITPFIMKRFYAGGDPEGDTKLKSYTQTLGLSLSGSRWHTPSLKQFVNYSVSREEYQDDRVNARFGGHNHNVGTTLMYLNGAKQYFGAGVDYSRRTAGQDVNAYHRYNGRVFWGQEWPLGFSTNTSISLAKRQYKAEWLGIMRRKNTEINGNLSVWHKAVHFKGITPRLTFQYHKTKSNIPIYSYDKKNLFIELDKSF